MEEEEAAAAEEQQRHTLSSEGTLCFRLASLCDPDQSAQPYPPSAQTRPLHDNLHSFSVWRTSAAAGSSHRTPNKLKYEP